MLEFNQDIVESPLPSLENKEDSTTPPRQKIRSSLSSKSDEDKVDSDIEDIFLDAMGEIQEASVKLNQTLGSSRSLGVMTREQRFESFSTPLDTEDFHDAEDQ